MLIKNSFYNREDTNITARLQTRKFGQAPILLLLTSRQALSSHPRPCVMILWKSMNFHSEFISTQFAKVRTLLQLNTYLGACHLLFSLLKRSSASINLLPDYTTVSTRCITFYTLSVYRFLFVFVFLVKTLQY